MFIILFIINKVDGAAEGLRVKPAIGAKTHTAPLRGPPAPVKLTGYPWPAHFFFPYPDVGKNPGKLYLCPLDCQGGNEKVFSFPLRKEVRSEAYGTCFHITATGKFDEQGFFIKKCCISFPYTPPISPPPTVSLNLGGALNSSTLRFPGAGQNRRRVVGGAAPFSHPPPATGFPRA